jgi:glycine oxidase
LEFDTLIIGQGIAGTTLAWALRWRGQRVLVVDREEAATSSRVAAGLITPVTGPRLVKAWRWDELRPAAEQFYLRVESELGSPIADWRPSVRLLETDSERTYLSKRLPGELNGLVVPRDDIIRRDWFHGGCAGIEMKGAGRLHVSRYLTKSRERWASEGGYLAASLDPGKDIEFAGGQVHAPRINVTAARVIFCDGAGAGGNPWLSRLRFNPARGEILTVQIPGLDEDRAIHAGLWMTRESGDRYRVGATYDWQDFNSGPTQKGKDELVGRLKTILKLPFEVVDHVSAVRPILHQLPPVIGLLPHEPRIGAFNGLGSKGSLQAPFFGEQFASHLVEDKPIDCEVDLAKRLVG